MSYNYDPETEWLYEKWEDDNICDNCGNRMDGIGFCPVCDYDHDESKPLIDPADDFDNFGHNRLGEHYDAYGNQVNDDGDDDDDADEERDDN